MSSRVREAKRQVSYWHTIIERADKKHAEEQATKREKLAAAQQRLADLEQGN
jgi:hypothetical protein